MENDRHLLCAAIIKLNGDSEDYFVVLLKLSRSTGDDEKISNS